jgi:hypothetical protein
MGWSGTGLLRNWFAQHRPRGAAVPFEAPALQMARVCDDERDGLIAILRDFANNGAAYVVPWANLPLITAMNQRDMALHQAVGEAKACTPAQVRAVVRTLALSGVLGPEAKAREKASSQAEQTRAADIELILVLHLLDGCGAHLAALAAHPSRWRASEAKAAVAAAAASIGVKRQDIHRRLGEFAALLGPVGLPVGEGESQAGWLRVLHDEITDFGNSTAAAAASAWPEVGAQLAAIADAAGRTAQLAGIVLGMLDYAVLDIAGTIRRWDSELPVLRQAIDRLSLMLDEWPSLMKSTRDALRGPAGHAAEQLLLVRSMLPRLPESDQSQRAGAADATQSVARALGKRLAAIRAMLRAPCAALG